MDSFKHALVWVISSLFSHLKIFREGIIGEALSPESRKGSCSEGRRRRASHQETLIWPILRRIFKLLLSVG